MTHKQFRAWRAWQQLQWEIPSAQDWYLMKIACEVRRVLMKEPGKCQPKDFKHERAKPQVEKPLEVRVQESMKFWKTVLGPPPWEREQEDKESGRLGAS